jgi:hypothetical protein
MPFGPNAPFNSQQQSQQQHHQQHPPPSVGQQRGANQHPFSRMGQPPRADAAQTPGSQALPSDGRLKLAATKLEESGAANASGSEGRRTRSGKFTLAQLRVTDGIVPLQSGTNQFDSQRGMTGFGMPRDVKGKHLKRIWELEFPDEEDDVQQAPVNLAPSNWTPSQQPQQGYSQQALQSPPAFQ